MLLKNGANMGAKSKVGHTRNLITPEMRRILIFCLQIPWRCTFCCVMTSQSHSWMRPVTHSLEKLRCTWRHGTVIPMLSVCCL